MSGRRNCTNKSANYSTRNSGFCVPQVMPEVPELIMDNVVNIVAEETGGKAQQRNSGSAP